MSILRINGGHPLEGSVRVHGAKNSVLPIMAASLLARGETTIHNCPNLSDVDAAIKILTHLGCKVTRSGGDVTVDSSVMARCDVPHELMSEMRSSVIFLGAVLARCKCVIMSMPGGCELGPRPVDLHLMALRQMGAQIIEEGGNINCCATKLTGCQINLSLPSVGATENAMLAATQCEGVTVITNAAREPEICDLENYLKTLGFNVRGAGTPTVTIEGVDPSLDIRNGTEHTVIPDRIVAATYLSAAAATSGRIEITDVKPAHITTITDCLSQMGCKIRIDGERVYIDAGGQKKAIRPVSTCAYPGFPTDAQPPLMAASLTAEGTTVFIEYIFENRFRHADELQRMGADIILEGRVAIITGVPRIHGAPVAATDLRGGAALCVAALCAEGTTNISGVRHIDRGYDGLEEALRSLGADIERI